MSLLTKGGISKLSQLEIDADKDWLTFGITNLKQVAAAMGGGDLAVRGLGAILVRLGPGVANMVLTSAGPGALPVWAPGGTYLQRYFPVTIALAVVVAKNTTRDYTNAEPAPITSEHVTKTGDDVSEMVKMLAPALALTDVVAKNTTRDYTNAEPAVIGSDLETIVA